MVTTTNTPAYPPPMDPDLVNPSLDEDPPPLDTPPICEPCSAGGPDHRCADPELCPCDTDHT
jgi:hypothetical protein